jgi:hypothetical protein
MSTNANNISSFLRRENKKLKEKEKRKKKKKDPPKKEPRYPHKKNGKVF